MIKKILAGIVAAAMSISAVSVVTFAEEEVQLPQCVASEITGDALKITDDFTLDFGMTFATNDTVKDLIGNPVADWLVDYEITFSEDTTAILAGQYDNYDEDWVIGNFVEEELGLSELGYEFKKGETVKIMETFFAPIFKEYNANQSFTYTDVVTFVKTFNCGVKVTGNKDVDITLKLCLYEAERGPVDENGHVQYITNGVEHTVFEQDYPYESLTTRLDETGSDVDKAEIINEIADEYNKDVVVEAIKGLDEEGKEAISVETIEKLAATVPTEGETGAEVSTIEGTNTTITISVEENSKDEADHTSLKEGIIYDIDAFENGSEVLGVLDAPVLVKIPVADSSLVKEVRHCHGGVVESIPFTKGNGYIAFTMVKFSQVSIITDAEPETGKAVLEFVPNDTDATDGILTYDLVLRGSDINVVKYFTSGEFSVTASDAIARWNIKAINDETNIKLESQNGNTRKYLVNLKAWDKVNSWTANITDENLVLGTLTVEGYGVEGYIAFENGILMNKHDITSDAENLPIAIETEAGKSAHFDIPVPERKLTVKVIANHNVANQNWKYQDMTVTISGVDLKKDLSYNLGDGGVDVDFANNTYTVEADLLLDRDYTVTVEGAGYRSAEYNVTMTNNKTVVFWNNAKDYEDAMEIYEENGSEVKKGLAKVNFLAGDIVNDNQINIYDLSAVVSYFDEKVTDFTQKNSLAQYDLNRDGNINSRDISILLESWGR